MELRPPPTGSPNVVPAGYRAAFVRVNPAS